MNDSNYGYNNVGNNTYRATTNLNKAIEDLNADNINSATSVNVMDSSYDNVSNSVSEGYNSFFDGMGRVENTSIANNGNNYIAPNNGQNTSIDSTVNRDVSDIGINPSSISNVNGSFINSNNMDVYIGEDAVRAVEKNVQYEPAMEVKKKPENTDNAGSFKELFMLMGIVLVLVLFIWAMPYLYDFISDFWLEFRNR